MNSKYSRLKKTLTGIVVFGLVFGPSSTALSLTIPYDSAADNGWLVTSDSSTLLTPNTSSDWSILSDSSNLLTTSGTANSNTGGTSNGTQAREKKDSQANQQEAKELEQKQKTDEEECNKQGGGLGSGASNALSQAVQPAMQQAVENTIQQGIKEAIPAAIESGIKQVVPNIIKTSLTNQLPTLIKNQLPSNLQNRLTQERAAGTDLTNNTILSSIVQDEIKKTINNGLPSILNQSLTNNLPAVLSQYLQSNLSTLVSQNVSANLPTNLQNGLSQALSTGNISDQIDTALRSALEESGNTLSEQVISSIDTTAFTQISDQLTSAISSNMDSLTESITSGLTENLGNTLDTLTESLTTGLTSTITNNLTGQLDSMINQITSSLTNPINQAISGITDQLNGTINNMMDSIMSPINDMMSNMMDTIMSPINDMMSNMMDTIMSPVTDMLNNVTSSIANTVGSTVGNAVGSAVGNTVGTTVGNTVGTTLGGAVGGIAGGVVGGLIGGGFVPVKEQDGPLLKATKSIDSTTGEIKKLTVEICKHTKAIKRIQQAFEEKEFVSDAEATREARTKTEQYRQGILSDTGLLAKGYDSTGNGADSALYVKDLSTHLQSVRDEQFNIFQTQLKDSGSDYSDNIRQVLEEANNASDLEALKPTLDKSTKDKLINNPKSFSTGEEFYDALLKFGDMRNNPSSILIAQDILKQRQNAAEQNAREEIVAGNGYLPTRKCVEKVGEYCAKYETITPAAMIKDTSSQTMGARVDEYIQAREASDIADGNEPQVNEVATMQPSTSGGGGSNGASSGSGGSGFDLSSLMSLFGDQGSGGSSSGGLDLSSLMNMLGGQGGLDLSSITGGLTSKPTVSITLNKTSASTAQIKWTVSGASICKANNDWYSLDETNNDTQIIKASGNFIGVGSNSLDIKIPIPAPAIKLKIRQGALVYDLGTTVGNRTDGLAKETIFSLSDDASYKPKLGDTYALSIGDQSVSFTNYTDSVASGINGLKTAVAALSSTSAAGQKFSQLKFTFNPSAGKIAASMTTNYKIKCTGLTGSTEAQTSQ